MKLSTRCRYGTRAVVEIARNYQKGPTKRKEIVARQGLTDSYLENILLTLKNTSIIGTVRGAKGGFVLRKAPADITILEIVEALEGPMEPVDCLGNPGVCQRVRTCVTRPVWEKMQQAQREALRSVTIQHLVEESNHPKKGTGN